MKDQSDSLKCAHYVSKYLPLTENWIYKEIINHRQYTPIFLSRKTENLGSFPISFLYSLDQLPYVHQKIEILFFKTLGYFNFFRKQCLQHRVRILHVHFGYHAVKMLGLKRKLRIPLVCSFYGDDAFAHHHTGKYTKLFAEADKVLVLGEYMKAQLIRLGCAEQKIAIHHLGIDIENVQFRKRAITKGTPIRFLLAARFVRKKGIDLAIKALAQLKDQHSFFVDIVGEGPLKEEIVNEIEHHKMTDRVTFHGYQSYTYFINLAYQCHVFIQASRTTAENNKEGTPMAIVDAMATGMAVVSTRHSDIPEIVRDGETGYLAEENDLHSLVDAIHRMINDPEKIEQFSVRGREWIEQEFDARKQTEKLEGHYNQLVSQRMTIH
jgi:colanic acid/amylovoran biosynthesis glycosyltransferase